MERKLIFVYNAKTDPMSAIVDYAHKVINPSTYKCELCALTHHNLGERSAWKNFRKSVNADFQFMYIRGFERKFNLLLTYPVIIEDTSEGFVTVMDKDALQKTASVEELINQLKDLLEK